jgi:protein SCO1/2
MRALMPRRPVWGLVALLLMLATPAAGAAENDGAAAFDPAAAVKSSQSVIGSTPGDYVLYDRAGRRVSLSSYRGKPLLVSFVYSGCFQACPVATKLLANAVAGAQRALGAGSFNVITIGFNLPFDTPQAMADFARRQGVTLPNWEFLSPEAAGVEQLAREFGFTYRATQGGFDHVTQVTIVTADGIIMRQVYGDSFELPLLIEPLKQLLTGSPAQFEGLAQMIEKVRLVCTVYDPVSGQYRFNYTVFIEIFAGFTIVAAVLLFLIREWRRNRKLPGV